MTLFFSFVLAIVLIAGLFAFFWAVENQNNSRWAEGFLFLLAGLVVLTAVVALGLGINDILTNDIGPGE